MKQLMGHYKLDLIINILIVLIMTFVLIFRCECGLPWWEISDHICCSLLSLFREDEDSGSQWQQNWQGKYLALCSFLVWFKGVKYYRQVQMVFLITLQVIERIKENSELIEEYEVLATDLLEWIQITIVKLSDRKFANTLVGVQQQMLEFNQYRTQEKPPR